MSVKKAPSKRRPAQAEAPAQSPAARQAAEAQLRALIDKFAPTHLRRVSALRKSLQKRLPTANEIVYEYRDCFVISYSPNEHGYEGALALRASADSIKLYFNFAKCLPDPEKLLRGSGGQARWIEVEGASTLVRPEITRLIDEAIARNPTPFARTGAGSVILRSASAKK